MAEDFKLQLSNAKNELANFQSALDKIDNSLKKTDRGTPRYQSLLAQRDRARANVKNAETKVRNAQAAYDRSTADTQRQKFEDTLARAKDIADPAATAKAQAALDAFNQKTQTQVDAVAQTAAKVASDKAAADKAAADKAAADKAAAAKTAGSKTAVDKAAADKAAADKAAADKAAADKAAADAAAKAGAANTVDKAIAKAIELYQMPDIIFNNVPELKAILNKYLDPKTPITLDQFINEVGNSTWYRQNSKEIKNRFLQKFNYDDLVSKGQAKGDTQYEQDIKRITQQVIDKGRQLGAPVDPTQAKLIAEDLYIHNMDQDTAALTKRLAGSIRQTPLGTQGISGYTGQAQQDYQALLKLAKDNGLNLRTILPARVGGATDQEITNNVLAGLADGSIDVSAIQQTARSLAAQGQPQYVKDLLAQGYDLAQVYAPYKTVMKNVLELNPDQIDLNDPTLRSAISNNGEMNIYDFTRALRKDPRWQYTSNARQDVSNAVLGVLKDFGFQG